MAWYCFYGFEGFSGRQAAKGQLAGLFLIYILGMIGNSLIKIVLWKKGEKNMSGQRSLTNIQLFILAMFDNLFLLGLFFEACYTTPRNWKLVLKDPSYVWSSVGCRMLTALIEETPLFIRFNATCLKALDWQVIDYTVVPSMFGYVIHILARFFQMMSVYQTVIIAMFQYIAVCHPYQAINVCTRKNAARAMVAVFCMCCIVHSPSYLFLNGQLEYNACVENRTHFTCLTRMAQKNFFFNMVPWHTLYVYIHIVGHHVVFFLTLPLSILLVLNILMIRDLRKTAGDPSKETETRAVTRLVVAIVTVFLITYSMKLLYIIDVEFLRGKILKWFTRIGCPYYFTMSTIFLMTPCLNSSVNIVLYLLLKRSFRRHFKQLVIEAKNKVFGRCKKN